MNTLRVSLSLVSAATLGPVMAACLPVTLLMRAVPRNSSASVPSTDR